jgi:trk system potassium uptake protein
MQDKNNPDYSYGRRPGDRTLRVPRARPIRFLVPEVRQRSTVGISLWMLVYGFAGIIAIGTILLMLPISSRSGLWTPFVDSLFTATSAVCVTGLVVVDTLDHWNFFGQLVILILIQIGGLGFMTVATVLLMAARRRIGLRQRMLISESAGISVFGGIVRLTRNIAYFTLIAEAVGAAIFFTRFSTQYGWQTGLWKSIFQSIAAFNNAGFDLFGGFRSLTGYQSDYLVLLTTAGLIILGGISFLSLANISRARGLHHSSVDTKIVLLVTGILLFLGTAAVLLTEFNSPETLGALPWPLKILNAFFQSTTSRTAGFNSVNIGAMAADTLFFVMILMFIGGASGSTAGGIKVNTAGLIMATIWNTIRGKEFPGAFDREFTAQQVYRAMTLLILSLLVIAVAVLILSVTEKFSFIRILFESVSAFGTVGLSTGITPDLSTIGRLIIIAVMFIGRIGPLTFTLVVIGYQKLTIFHYPKETIRLG